MSFLNPGFPPASLRSVFTGLLLALTLSACGGGGGSNPASEVPPPVSTATCNPDDGTTADECGVLYLAFTDADGDFLSYTVDVLSLSLTRANGSVVETLPNQARVNFTDYVELTEFVSARNLPPGNYVSGTIRLDYSNSEIMVESNGVAVPAIIVDQNGMSIDTIDLEIRLSDTAPLNLQRGIASLLVVDFDLAASHTVDLTSDPVLAVTDPFIVAEIEPVDEKDIRVRGPLVSVLLAESSYTVRLRPFHHRDGDNGQVDVLVTDDTEYEIDGVPYSGTEGLEAMAALSQGTATRALGVLNISNRTFTAFEVLAGSSVPGADRDAVKGHVTSRSGDQLTIIGTTVIPSDRDVFFNDTVTVTLGPDTRVYQAGERDAVLDKDDISVGQRVLIAGELVESDPANLVLDATNGTARLYRTRLSGFINQAMPGQIDIDLRAIGRRRPAMFDFTGTGVSPDQDANPNNYEVATSVLNLDGLVPGSPVRAYGFANRFGFAPPDFEGRTVIDYNELRATLGIGWTTEGSASPFSVISAEGLVPDPAAYLDDARHAIKIGPRIIDLTELGAGITIQGSDAERTLYGIRGPESVQLYHDFGRFTDALAAILDGSERARSMYAHGSYNVDTNVFSATKLWVFIVRNDNE